MTVGSPSYATLSAMITPALFMTATGSLIISTSNRMARIVDRIRALNEAGDRLDRGEGALDFPAERLAHLAQQLEFLLRRSGQVRMALMSLYLAFGSFVGTSLTLALDVWADNRIRALPTALAIVGVILLLGACAHLVLEALEALQGNALEAQFYRDLRARRAVEGRGAPG